MMSLHPQIIKHFFDETTNTFSYVVVDPATQQCAIIDSVLDYDAASATTSTTHADQIIAYIQANQLQVQWILETHVHADHLTASHYLKQRLGGKIAISKNILKNLISVYKLCCCFKNIFEIQYDLLL